MATPNWNTLNLQHSRNIGDAVVSVIDDGTGWSSVQRDNHLNIACQQWWLQMFTQSQVSIEDNDFSFAQFGLRGYINEEILNLSNYTFDTSKLSNGCAYIISLINLSYNPYQYIRKASLKEADYSQTSLNKFLTTHIDYQKFVMNGEIITCLGSAPSDNVRVTYLSPHNNISVNGAVDIPINSEYWDEILKLAFGVYAKEDPDPITIGRYQLESAQINQRIQES